jgi:hypothetical protein
MSFRLVCFNNSGLTITGYKRLEVLHKESNE